MYYSVTTTRTVVHGIIVHQPRFSVNQVFGLYNFVDIHVHKNYEPDKGSGIEEETIGIAPVGCAVFAYNYLDIDWIEAAHGRAPAIASAVKRLNPKKMVFTYQGDGDLAAIGTAETIHACNRGENIAIIFINNGIYGMTGGQMAPTTLEGMVTSTCPYGRNVALNGYPLRIAEYDCYVCRSSALFRSV